jgi:glycerol transport system ATP-binding protein
MNFLRVGKRLAQLHFGPAQGIPAVGRLAGLPEGAYVAGFRANHVRIDRPEGEAMEFRAIVTGAEITGSETFLHLDHQGQRWVGLVPGVRSIEPGTPVPVWLDPAHVYVFDEGGTLVAPASYAMVA